MLKHLRTSTRTLNLLVLPLTMALASCGDDETDQPGDGIGTGDTGTGTGSDDAGDDGTDTGTGGTGTGGTDTGTGGTTDSGGTDTGTGGTTDDGGTTTTTGDGGTTTTTGDGGTATTTGDGGTATTTGDGGTTTTTTDGGATTTTPPIVDPSYTCGDGIQGANEACDDGNNNNGDGCSEYCELEDGGDRAGRCGDGVEEHDELCDWGDGSGVYTTEIDLQSGGPGMGDEETVWIGQYPGCTGPLANPEGSPVGPGGDGVVNPGDQWDPDNLYFCNDNNNDCTASCTRAICGDGKLQAGESCDFGPHNGTGETFDDPNVQDCFDDKGKPCEDPGGDNYEDDDTCDDECALGTCGNAVREGREECDLGAGNSDNGDCTPQCTIPRCGDGLLHTGSSSVGSIDGKEECDDGNNVGGDDCNAFCQDEWCGNGRNDEGEECDYGTEADGNNDDRDNHPICDGDLVGHDDSAGSDTCDNFYSCNTGDQCLDNDECSINDGIYCVDTYYCEHDQSSCDGDGDDAACSGSCQFIPGGGAECDDNSGVYAGDSCSAGPDGDEYCSDNGNTSGRCAESVCVNGGPNDGLYCDSAGDCAGDCIYADVDVCDGGPNNNGVCNSDSDCFHDVCVNRCRLSELPCSSDAECNDYACNVRPQDADDSAPTGRDGEICNTSCDVVECGNGTKEGDEECDDGNTDWGDGCDTFCREETCGDGIVQPLLGEQCDEGDNDDDSGCSDTCQLRRPGDCGNNTVESPEECDDGNANADDRQCTSVCRWNRCGDGLHNGQENLHNGCGDDTNPNCTDSIEEECDDGNTDPSDHCITFWPVTSSRGCPAGEDCGYVENPHNDPDVDRGDIVSNERACVEHVCGDGIVAGSGGPGQHGLGVGPRITLSGWGPLPSHPPEDCDFGEPEDTHSDCRGSTGNHCAFHEDCNGPAHWCDPGDTYCKDLDGNNGVWYECNHPDNECNLNCEDASCGDGVLQWWEQCDGSVFINDKNTCASWGYNDPDNVSCTSSCTIDDSSC